MKCIRKKSLIAALCGVAAVGSANSAIINVWDVTAVANFVPASITPGGGVITASNTAVAPTQLRWGNSTGFGRSGLDITNLPAPVQVNTSIAPNPLNPAVPTTTITHLNQPITGTSLSSVNLLSTLTLKPNSPAFPALPSVDITFGITFLETPNGNNGDACAGGGISGAAGVNVNGCADIFVIDKNALNFSFFYDTDAPLTGDPAQEYFISFLETTSGLNPLNATACLSATGSNAPCLGFLTPERSNTPVTFGALISTEKVVINIPEPGALGLMGLSLALLGFVGRRKT